MTYTHFLLATLRGSNLVKLTSFLVIFIIGSLLGCTQTILSEEIATQNWDFASTPPNPLLLSDPLGVVPSSQFPPDPIAYFEDSTSAHELASSGNCEMAVDLLTSLLRQYRDDSSIWYDLAVCQDELKRHSEAIYSYSEALALGTTWYDSAGRGEPSSILLDIARQHMALGEVEPAMDWFQKAMDSRYKPHDLAINIPEFRSVIQQMNATEQFGVPPEKELSRIEQWQFDISFLAHKTVQTHVDPNYKSSASEISNHFTELLSQIETLTDAEITAKLHVLIGKLGTGHDIMLGGNALTYMAFKPYFFNDGLYIIDAEDESLIGSRIDKFGSVSTEAAFAKVRNSMARDNNMSAYWTGMRLLLSPDILRELGIVDSTEDFDITLTNASGEVTTITPQLRSVSNTTPSLSAGSLANPPLYLSDQSTPIWYRLISDDIVYIQVNFFFWNMPDRFEPAVNEFAELIRSIAAKNVILDLRHSQGGRIALSAPIVKALVGFELSDQSENLYVVIGRNTFSTAQMLIGELERLTNPIFVGEPSGGRQTFAGDSSAFTLPFSGLNIISPTSYGFAGYGVDQRIWIAPDIPITLSSAQYFRGTDPTLDTVLKLIRN